MRRDYIGAGEINRMGTVRRVVDAYRARAAHANAATWATENKADNALLIQAWRAAYGE